MAIVESMFFSVLASDNHAWRRIITLKNDNNLCFLCLWGKNSSYLGKNIHFLKGLYLPDLGKPIKIMSELVWSPPMAKVNISL